MTYEQARPYAKAIANAVTNRHDAAVARGRAGGHISQRASAHRSRAADVDGVGRGRCAQRRSERTCRRSRYSPTDGRSANLTSCSRCWRTIAFPQQAPSSTEWFYIPTNFTEAKWVKSIEVRPGDRAAVHHVLVYYRAKPDGKPVADRAGEPEGISPIRRLMSPASPGIPRRTDLTGMPPRLVATYAPGTNPQVAPCRHRIPTRARRDHRAADALHRQRASRPRTARKSALRSRPNRSPREVRAQHFMNMAHEVAGRRRRRRGDDRPRISPGRDRVGSLPAHASSRQAVGIHARAAERREEDQSCRCRDTTSTGRRITCSRNRCRCRKDRRSFRPRGTTTRAANKNNPNPKVDVLWGDQTWQEMQYTGILLSPN